ncbi:hypothetical protein F5144DRAFT_565292 [Chaetomium tenue]|uniref:Uncharacterized protein n=1 Tax=Chaetomium tenue TaxID=1854479 RepID=A0ACB7PNJ4_9PEZI|nr:hypothetical protein F5144DRAFT_565292 [Chaetomium globosum]
MILSATSTLLATMGPDTPLPTGPNPFSALALSPVETRKDAIVVLRRDSASSRGSSQNTSATPTNSSPRPSANPRFMPVAQLDLSSDSPPLTPIPNNLLPPVDEEPNTPSSTIVEFGDLGRGSVPSAAQLVESIHRSFSQSRVEFPESRSSSKVRGPHDGRESREGRERREHSRSRSVATPTAPRDRSQSAQRRSNTPKETKTSAATDRGLADDRINRFLQSMAQQATQASEADLLQENRSLYQRIAALQRTEREMLAENQDLTRRLSAVKQHHERRARQWNEGLRRKETEYEARMRELGEQLLDLASRNPQKLPHILSNDQISAWFNEQDLCWNRWATTFGHQEEITATQQICATLIFFASFEAAG